MTCDLIVIGAGSSAAYYLGTLRDYDLKSPSQTVKILCIGKADPWAGARGYQPGTYAQNINQSQQMAAHRTGSAAPMSKDARDRKEWADQNSKIIKAVTGQDPIQEEVVRITRAVPPVTASGSVQPEMFCVKTREGKELYYARRVVIATGAGIEDDQHSYHNVPGEVTAFRNSSGTGNKYCMDLDVFMRDIKKGAGNANKKVVILGPAAGTDAVMQAGTVGFRPENVYWFMTTWSTGGLINVMDAPGRFTREQSAGRIVVVKRNSTAITQSGNQIRVAFQQEQQENGLKNAPQPLLVDYYVYAIGQDQKSALTGKQDDMQQAKSFLDSDLLGNLKPLYDVNQQLAEFGSSSAAYQHVTGLQLKGSTSNEGLTVIGAAAYQIAVRDKIDHSYLQQEFSAVVNDLLRKTVCFEAAALSFYPELLLEPSLSALRTRNIDKTRLASREAVFLLDFADRLKESLKGERPSSGDAASNADVLIKQYMGLAKDACYYFKLRVDAAEYLYEADGKIKPKLDVAEMQTAGHKRMLPNTVGGTGGGAAPLLGAIERNVSAINAPVPEHVTAPTDVSKGLNFLESPTTIRIYIALHYPKISEDDAQKFIQKVLTERKTKDKGFSAGEIRQFQEELLRMEKADVIKEFQQAWPNVRVKVKFR